MRSPLTRRIETDRARLVAAARRILRSHAEAEDAVHDLYLRTLARDTPVEAPDAWLRTAVRHAAIDRLRADARARHAHAALDAAAGAESRPGSAPVPTHVTNQAAPDVAAALEAEDEVVLALDALVGRVAPHAEALWLLREVFAVDHATLARALGATEAASRQAVQRARRALDTPRARRRAAPGDDDFLAVCRHALASGEAGALLAFVASQPVARATHAGTRAAGVPLMGTGAGTGAASGARLHQQLAFVDGRCALVLRHGNAILCVVPLGPSEELRVEA